MTTPATGTIVHLTAADGFTFPAYVAQPQGQPRGAVVVIQEIFGVNSHIRSVADGYAAAGYVAVAPAIYHRVKPGDGLGVELGYTDADIQSGFGLKTASEALQGAGSMEDIQAAVNHAAQLSGGKVGVVGYCWGGLLTWRSACLVKGVAAAAPYYGGGVTTPEETARQPQCPVLAHFADEDSYIPMDTVETFRQAHPEVELHVYRAHHGFNCDQRGSYDATAAAAARERTLAFFAQHIG